MDMMPKSISDDHINSATTLTVTSTAKPLRLKGRCSNKNVLM